MVGLIAAQNGLVIMSKKVWQCEPCLGVHEFIDRISKQEWLGLRRIMPVLIAFIIPIAIFIASTLSAKMATCIILSLISAGFVLMVINMEVS